MEHLLFSTSEHNTPSKLCKKLYNFIWSNTYSFEFGRFVNPMNLKTHKG